MGFGVKSSPAIPEAFSCVIIDIQLRDAGSLVATRPRGRSGGAEAKLGEKQIREIKMLLRDLEVQVSDVAQRHGVSRTIPYSMRTPPRPMINRGFRFKRVVGGGMTGKLGE